MSRTIALLVVAVLLAAALGAAHADAKMVPAGPNDESWSGAWITSVEKVGGVVQLNYESPKNHEHLWTRVFLAEYKELLEMADIKTLSGATIHWQITPALRGKKINDLATGIRVAIQCSPERLRFDDVPKSSFNGFLNSGATSNSTSNAANATNNVGINMPIDIGISNSNAVGNH